MLSGHSEGRVAQQTNSPSDPERQLRPDPQTRHGRPAVTSVHSTGALTTARGRIRFPSGCARGSSHRRGAAWACAGWVAAMAGPNLRRSGCQSVLRLTERAGRRHEVDPVFGPGFLVNRASSLDDAVQSREPDQLDAGVDTELAIDVRAMCFHCLDADTELGGNLAIGEAANDHREELALAL
jgi:hypothetical protein